MKKSEDFFYSNEIESVSNIELISAFSHDQEKLIFVQDKIVEHGKELWEFIHKKQAWLYICGHSAMSNGVSAALCEIAVRYGNLSLAEAQEYFRNMQSLDHFQHDVFTS
jgi:sulfite reductase (NADPH) flavoprotein alpha-component